MIRRLLIVLAILIPAIAVPCTMKTWTGSETIQSTDLNANFLCLNTKPDSTTPGAGTITNSMVSNTAAISTSKLLAQYLIPRAWAVVDTLCDGSAAAGTSCTVLSSMGIDWIKTNGAAGQWRVKFKTTSTDVYQPANTKFLVAAQDRLGSPANICFPSTPVAGAGDGNGTNFLLKCNRSDTFAAAGPLIFSFVVYDSP